MPKKRTTVLFDKWSLVHLGFGISFGLLLNPYLAIILLASWEPLEIFVLSPVLSRLGVVFGYETLQNSLSDILFDSLGVLLGLILLRLI